MMMLTNVWLWSWDTYQVRVITGKILLKELLNMIFKTIVLFLGGIFVNSSWSLVDLIYMMGWSFIITSDLDPLLSILVKDHLEQRAILHLSEDQLATVVRASDYNCRLILLQNTIRDGRRTASKAVMKGWRGRMDGWNEWMDGTDGWIIPLRLLWHILLNEPGSLFPNL